MTAPISKYTYYSDKKNELVAIVSVLMYPAIVQNIRKKHPPRKTVRPISDRSGDIGLVWPMDSGLV